MKEKAISFIAGVLIGGILVFGYSTFFKHNRGGMGGGGFQRERGNFGSGSFNQTGSGNFNQQSGQAR